jgi:hypothetical protein
MKIENEIILAYHSVDDEPIGGSNKGWVSNFNKFLTTLIEQVSGQTPVIKLMTEKDADLTAYNSSAVLVSVLSKDFLESKTLMEGIQTFSKNADKNGGNIVNGVSRFFKVLKFPVEIDELLPQYANILTYDFYQIDPLTGEPQEFNRFFSNEAERGYWMKLVDMAYDIYQIQKEFTEDEKSSSGQTKIEKKKTIYLANTGVDMIIQRDIVKRELIRHGYKVLPDHSLPKEAKSLQDMVMKDLEQCCLSIHLIGEDYGYKAKGSDLSVVDLQNKIAAKHTYDTVEYNKVNNKDEKFTRLIWLSPELKNVSERQKIFIEDIKGDAASLEEAEVLQISLQELKSIIREELITGGRFKKKEIVEMDQLPEDGSLVYFIYDKLDLKAAKLLEKYLKEKGVNVVSSIFEGDLVDLRYLHQENLRRCDASLIYHGNSSDEWIKTKLQDLLKAPGFGRVKPFKVRAVYVEDKAKANTENIERNKAMILGDGVFTPETIEPFLAKLEN